MTRTLALSLLALAACSGNRGNAPQTGAARYPLTLPPSAVDASSSHIDVGCSNGMHFEQGPGCVADEASTAPAPSGAPASPPPMALTTNEAELRRWQFPAAGKGTNVRLPFHFVRGPVSTSTATAPFDRAAAAASPAAVDISSCKEVGGPTGRGHVSVAFAPNGLAEEASIDGPPFAGTATGGCIAGRFRGATPIPAFAGAIVTVGRVFAIE